MNLNEFDETYANKKGADKIEINCDHPDHEGSRLRSVGKTAARRNILKNESQKFICRECCMKFDNPMNKIGQGRQTDEIISVQCPSCSTTREMKKTCYYGTMEEPYQQTCKSCAQEGKVISEEQKDKISQTMTGRKLSEEHVQNMMKYRENNPEWREKSMKNLIPGYSGGWNKGLQMPEEVKKKISESRTGQECTLEHRYHISEGRKKMLKETGGFTKEHREKLSKATIQQYKDGFDSKLHHLKGWHHSPKLNTYIYYRSSYEKRAFMILDADDNVLKYTYEEISIEYQHPEKDITSQYLIDLLVSYKDGTTKIIEIKPEKCVNYPVNLAKTEAAKITATNKGYAFEIWTEKELHGKEDTDKKSREFHEWLIGIISNEKNPNFPDENPNQDLEKIRKEKRRETVKKYNDKVRGNTVTVYCEFCKENHTLGERQFNLNMEKNGRYICIKENGHLIGKLSNKKVEVDPLISEGKKRCRHCGEVLVLDKFCLDKSRVDGYCRVCQDCNRKLCMDRYNRKKNAQVDQTEVHRESDSDTRE